MLIKSRGIVFRTLKYGETSLIVEIFTEGRGLCKYLINGVRSAKARTKANLLQVMSILDIVAYEREGRELNRLKEIQAAYWYQGIPFDVKKGAVGLFMTEVARKAIREREENQALFRFLLERFTGLDQTSHSIANYHLCFLLELTAFLGFQPSETHSEETPIFDLREGEFVSQVPEHNQFIIDEEAAALAGLLSYRAADAHQFVLSRELRQRLLSTLIIYYQLHLEGMGEIHAHQILKTVF
jgi:DNA repair protein RecO (recombination protein O)